MNSFRLYPDATGAILGVTAGGSTQEVLFNFEDETFTPFPFEAYCCVRGFVGDRYIFSERGQGGRGGRVHALNLKTLEDEVVQLPAGMSDFSSTRNLPGEVPQRLVFDSGGTVALQTGAVTGLADLDSLADLEILPLPTLRQLNVSADGRFLFFIVPAENPIDPDLSGEGDLFVYDLQTRGALRRLTPEGAQAGGHFLVGAPDDPIVVFWARFTRGSADLYFTDPAGSDIELVAPAIRNVQVNSATVFGVLNGNLADAVGDLVELDVESGATTILARSVREYVKDPSSDRVAFFIATRSGGTADGLWASTLPELLAVARGEPQASSTADPPKSDLSTVGGLR